MTQTFVFHQQTLKNPLQLFNLAVDLICVFSRFSRIQRTMPALPNVGLLQRKMGANCPFIPFFNPLPAKRSICPPSLRPVSLCFHSSSNQSRTYFILPRSSLLPSLRAHLLQPRLFVFLAEVLRAFVVSPLVSSPSTLPGRNWEANSQEAQGDGNAGAGLAMSNDAMDVSYIHTCFNDSQSYLSGCISTFAFKIINIYIRGRIMTFCEFVLL